VDAVIDRVFEFKHIVLQAFSKPTHAVSGRGYIWAPDDLPAYCDCIQHGLLGRGFPRTG